jgi:exodeoxyribonuclease VIII
MTHDEYSKQRGITASAIKHGRKSMLHMRHYLTAAQKEPSAAMVTGSMVHMAVLEPARYASAVTIYDGRRAGKEWEAFQIQNAESEILKPAEKEHIDAIAQSVLANRDAQFFLTAATERELSVSWDDPAHYGRAKARVDAFGGGVLADLKTTSKIEPRQFASQVVQLGVDLQLGWYRKGLMSHNIAVNRVVIIAVEQAAPHDVVVYDVPDNILADGYEKAAEIATRYRCCEACGSFPGVADGVQILELPEWAQGEAVIDMEGVTE